MFRVPQGFSVTVSREGAEVRVRAPGASPGALCSGHAAHRGSRHGPGTQVGTHAPSVLCRRTTVSTGCPHTGQAYVSLSMTPG